jgi:Uma2 family endonuclease
MGETDTHRKLMMALIETLEAFFLNEPKVYVSGNLMCYYEENNPKASISPDVFVVRGVAKHERRIYKFWEEPAPQVVLEISSKKTRKEDFGKKKDIYAWLSVREYFVFDPEAKLRAPLRAFRLRGAELVEERVVGQRVMSAELGLELVQTEGTLRLINPRTKTFLLTPAESYVRAEQEATRAARLAAKLRALGFDPEQL